MTEVLDPPTTLARATGGQLAHVGEQLPADPSIEQILYHAIENKVDVATLERIVALKERVDAKNAEKSFNAAMLAFRNECPRIQKTRAATDYAKKDDNGNWQPPKTLYYYADLEAITRIVTPILHRHGLSYTWDAEFSNSFVVTTCTIRHVDGHKASAKFGCAAEGTKIMNSAQKSASATTFGQRYSLLAALGISTDKDDDGANAAAKPSPGASTTTPKVSTRENRHAGAVTSAQVKELANAWVKKTGLRAGMTDFIEWAKWLLQTDRDLLNCANWTADDLRACESGIVDAKVIDDLYRQWGAGIDPTPPRQNFYEWCKSIVNPQQNFSSTAYWTPADVRAVQEALQQ